MWSPALSEKRVTYQASDSVPTEIGLGPSDVGGLRAQSKKASEYCRTFHPSPPFGEGPGGGLPAV